MTSGVRLRDATTDDVSTFFEHQLDPEARRMAAFTSKDPSDRDAFMAHWAKILGDDGVIMRTILFDEQVVGHVAEFERDGIPEVTYWIAKEFWGKGIATQALSALLRDVKVRPLYARVAKDNVGSLRVSEKCGFTKSGQERTFANARGEEIDEVIMKLD